MIRKTRIRLRSRKVVFLVLVGLFAIVTQLVLSQGKRLAREQERQTQVIGSDRLVSVQPLPELGQLCEVLPAAPQEKLVASLQQAASGRPSSASVDATVAAARATLNAIPGNRPPVRTIKDPYASFSAVTVDMTRNEIILQDENLFQIMTYDRMANTPPTATMTEPKRIISGPLTKVEFNCGLYVDPKTGDIYSIANDTVDTMVVFSRDQKAMCRRRASSRPRSGRSGLRWMKRLRSFS